MSTTEIRCEKKISTMLEGKQLYYYYGVDLRANRNNFYNLSRHLIFHPDIVIADVISQSSDLQYFRLKD